jgi:hypothetical protein
MDEVIRAQLPADLADKLIGEGFEEFLVFRGFVGDAGTVMTMASAGLAVGANTATIAVSRDQLREFVAGVRAWVLRKALPKPGEEIAIDFVGQARRRSDASKHSGRIPKWCYRDRCGGAGCFHHVTFPQRAAHDVSATSD